MEASLSGQVTKKTAGARFGAGQKALLAVVCIAAGFLPIAAGYIPGDSARLAGGLVVTVGYLGLALAARRTPAARDYWEVPLAFFGMALFVLADRYIPSYLVTHVLHDKTVAGNPYASTVSGTVLVQLNELLMTVVAVIVVLWIARCSPSSIYLRLGRFGRAYVIGIAGLAALYFLTYRALSHTSFMPVHGAFSFSRYVSLTPALLVMVAANGFLEELMFRGLLMSRLNLVFAPYLATFVQAVIFASWHVGVTYTSSVVVFVVLVVFPLGLLFGYLTRSSGSIFPSSIFHAGIDMPVYLGFLSYVS